MTIDQSTGARQQDLSNLSKPAASSDPAIDIDENSDLDTYNGTGTELSPKIIENKMIIGFGSASYGIRLVNTDLYVVIRDCMLTILPGDSCISAIQLDSVENVKIQRVKIFDVDKRGIDVLDSSSITIEDCYLDAIGTAITAYQYPGISIDNRNLETESGTITIQNNILRSCGGTTGGINIFYVKCQVNLINNTILGDYITEHDIWTADTWNVLMENNTLVGGHQHGLEVSGTPSGTPCFIIRKNAFDDNQYEHINLNNYVTGITIVWNVFYDTWGNRAITVVASGNFIENNSYSDYFEKSQNKTRPSTDGAELPENYTVCGSFMDHKPRYIFDAFESSHDSDNDGIADIDEVQKYRSNPYKVDTDGDGWTDGDEDGVFHSDPTFPHKAHDIIEVWDNSYFTAANGVIWGDGTAAEPYFIFGWLINETNTNLVYLYGTNAYVRFKNCAFVGASGGNTVRGVYAYSSSNIMIEDSTFSVPNWFGICLILVSGCTIDNNFIYGCNTGAWLSAVSGSTVTSNRFEAQSSYAMQLVSGTGTTLFSKNSFVSKGLMIDGSIPGTNSWDDGTYGNYWHDYTYWYPDATQNQPYTCKLSHTWNTPYCIPGSPDFTDNKPLVHPRPGLWLPYSYP
nr:right-handed parallel beta-helix repeat-containing protein [Candidatus Sigynarchaeota archaeon]